MEILLGNIGVVLRISYGADLCQLIPNYVFSSEGVKKYVGADLDTNP
jgi:hypothetical protein